MTQCDRVLRALRRAGPHGVTAVDFQPPDTIDGGPPILRLPSRVNDLLSAGHRIETRGRRHRCVVYVLAAAPPAAPSPAPPRDQEHAPRAFAAPSSPYDPWNPWS